MKRSAPPKRAKFGSTLVQHDCYGKYNAETGYEQVMLPAKHLLLIKGYAEYAKQLGSHERERERERADLLIYCIMYAIGIERYITSKS